MPAVNCRKTGFALIAALALSTFAQPILGGESEIDFLRSYVGEWRGSGVLVGGAQPEAFSCRMTIAPGNQAKINYVGRCSLVSLNLAVRGTIAYNSGARVYEAAMSSNTAFSGVAVGTRQGEAIVFDLQERAADARGSEMQIGSQIRLEGGGIAIDFDITFNNSGQTMHATVPFSR